MAPPTAIPVIASNGIVHVFRLVGDIVGDIIEDIVGEPLVWENTLITKFDDRFSKK